MRKSTKKNLKSEKKNVQLRVTISNDHFEALQQMEERCGVRVPSLVAAAFKAGMPEIQKRCAIDAETN